MTGKGLRLRVGSRETRGTESTQVAPSGLRREGVGRCPLGPVSLSRLSVLRSSATFPTAFPRPSLAVRDWKVERVPGSCGERWPRPCLRLRCQAISSGGETDSGTRTCGWQQVDGGVGGRKGGKVRRFQQQFGVVAERRDPTLAGFSRRVPRGPDSRGLGNSVVPWGPVHNGVFKTCWSLPRPGAFPICP